MRLTLNIIPVISVFYLVLGTNGVSIDKDLTLTASEKQILDQVIKFPYFQNLF